MQNYLKYSSYSLSHSGKHFYENGIVLTFRLLFKKKEVDMDFFGGFS